jgi:hypothetical protein
VHFRRPLLRSVPSGSRNIVPELSSGQQRGNFVVVDGAGGTATKRRRIARPPRSPARSPVIMFALLITAIPSVIARANRRDHETSKITERLGALDGPRRLPVIMIVP